jgi:hypothetical protein
MDAPIVLKEEIVVGLKPDCSRTGLATVIEVARPSTNRLRIAGDLAVEREAPMVWK